MADEDKLEFARLLIERWNRGDVDAVVDLFAEDAAMYAGPEWPEQATYRGHDGIRANIDQWRTVWEKSLIVADRIEEHGDRVVASGAWKARGRSSGVEGEMPFVILVEVRNGKIASFEWFTDHDDAVAAARRA
jgi:ketosteroid isomerase-like protein